MSKKNHVCIQTPFAIQVNVSCQDFPPKLSFPPAHVSLTLKELYVSADWLEMC